LGALLDSSFNVRHATLGVQRPLFDALFDARCSTG